MRLVQKRRPEEQISQGKHHQSAQKRHQRAPEVQILAALRQKGADGERHEHERRADQGRHDDARVDHDDVLQQGAHAHAAEGGEAEQVTDAQVQFFAVVIRGGHEQAEADQGSDCWQESGLQYVREQVDRRANGGRHCRHRETRVDIFEVLPHWGLTAQTNKHKLNANPIVYTLENNLQFVLEGIYECLDWRRHNFFVDFRQILQRLLD